MRDTKQGNKENIIICGKQYIKKIHENISRRYTKKLLKEKERKYKNSKWTKVWKAIGACKKIIRFINVS